MKKLLLWLVLLVVTASLQHCKKDGENLGPQKVQFTCNLTASDNTGGRMLSGTPTTLVLSLENTAHAIILTRKNIRLLRVGDSFITDPLDLLPGGYVITDFLLIDESSSVLYATPKAGSPLAAAVKHPLPYGFTVEKNNVANVEIEVVDVSARAPGDFGYVAFNISVVNPLSLAVFTTIGDDVMLSSAKAYILKDNDTIQRYSLEAKVNLISFKGDPDITHTLVVWKDGFTPFVKDFVYSDLVATLGKSPLKVSLLPHFTMLAHVEDDLGNSFQVQLNGKPGSIIVNWGDGSHDDYLLPPMGEPSVVLEHTFAASGNFEVTVTGAIDQITSFYSFYGTGMMDAINLQGLPELRDIRIGLTRGPATIDLRHNVKLESVMLIGIYQLENLLIPAESNISSLEISGPQPWAADPHFLGTPVVDDIINKVYHAAVLHHTTGGYFIFMKNWTPLTDDMLGPPSPASLDKLHELRDAYGWVVRPDPGS